MKSEVTILGLGPTRTDCPYAGDVWGVNHGYMVLPKDGHLDMLFIFDDIDQFFNKDDLRKLTYPIISNRKVEGVNVIEYPIKEMVREFKTNYFTNSICFMMAYALHLGYKKINLYGIDMLVHQGYVMEKGGVEYWVGYAQGRGAEVFIAEGSAICRTIDNQMYGYGLDYGLTWQSMEAKQHVMVA